MTPPPSQGLWTCAVGIPATIVCLAHKASTTVCPPPLSDTSYGGFTPIDDTDLATTTGCDSAGAQIDLVAAFCRLYDGKCSFRVFHAICSFFVCFCFCFVVGHSRLTGSLFTGSYNEAVERLQSM